MATLESYERLRTTTLQIIEGPRCRSKPARRLPARRSTVGGYSGDGCEHVVIAQPGSGLPAGQGLATQPLKAHQLKLSAWACSGAAVVGAAFAGALRQHGAAQQGGAGVVGATGVADHPTPMPPAGVSGLHSGNGLGLASIKE